MFTCCLGLPFVTLWLAYLSDLLSLMKKTLFKLTHVWMEAGQGSKDSLKHDRCQSNQSCDGAARKVHPKAPGCNAQWEISGENIGAVLP